MSEHTPGPWTEDGERIYQTGASTSNPIATLHPIDGMKDTLDANANLIAAAPALLEALEESREIYCCSCCSSGACKPTGPCRQCQDIAVRIDTAIRLAKGEN